MLPKIELTADSSVSGSIVVVAIDKKRDPKVPYKCINQNAEGADVPTYSSTAAAGFR